MGKQTRYSAKNLLFSADEMPFLSHIEEMRKLLIRSAVVFLLLSAVAYAFYDQIVAFLSAPFAALSQSRGGEDGKLYVGNVLEGFMVRLKITFLFGLVFSFPIHVYHAMRFVFPALHSYEKRILAGLLFLSFVFVVVSVYYSYGKIIPISIDFLTGAGFIPDQVGMLLRFNDNIFFVFQFILISLIVFQLPIVMQLLLLFNVVKRSTLRKNARIIVLVIFILCAAVTPPDPVSLLAAALPLVGIFIAMLALASLFRLGEE